MTAAPHITPRLTAVRTHAREVLRTRDLRRALDSASASWRREMNTPTQRARRRAMVEEFFIEGGARLDTGTAWAPFLEMVTDLLGDWHWRADST